VARWNSPACSRPLRPGAPSSASTPARRTESKTGRDAAADVMRWWRAGAQAELLTCSQETSGIKKRHPGRAGGMAYGYFARRSGRASLVRISPFDSQAAGTLVCQRVRLPRHRRDGEGQSTKRTCASKPCARAAAPARQQDRVGDSHHHVPTGIAVHCQQERRSTRTDPRPCASLPS